MAMGKDEQKDLNAGVCRIQNISIFKYLRVIITTNGKSSQDIINETSHGKNVIGKLKKEKKVLFLKINF